MGNFANFLGASEAPRKPEPAMREIGGTFVCQTCDEWVEEALWSPQSKTLGWKCSLGHLSTVEDFDL